MVALNVVQRLRHTNDLRAYRRKLTGELHQNIMLRLLPSLSAAPLPFTGADGAPHQIEDLLELPPYLLLAGITGSGRRLALQQLAQRMLKAEDTPTPALMLLPQIDDGRTAPFSLLATALHQAQQPGRAARKVPDAPPTTLAERLTGWALLIDGLEELAAHRQAAWRAMFQLAPQHWPATRVIVTVPHEEMHWPGFTMLAIGQAHEELIERWIGLLAPFERRAALVACLRPGGALAALDERIFEIALLALCAGRAALPQSRAELYEIALSEMFKLDRREPASQVTLERMQLLAAYDERPAALVAGLLEPTGIGGLQFTYPLLRSYLAAYQLVDESRYDLLGSLSAPERHEIARFCTTIAADVQPLFAELWGNGKPNAEAILTLGACLRERPNIPPIWVLRTISALALIARDGRPAQRGQATALLRANTGALDTAFTALMNADPSARRVIPQIISLLPHDLVPTYAERLASDPRMAAPMAWDLIDLLVSRQPQNATPLAPPDEPAARARWAYVQALRGPEQRAALANGLGIEGVRALAESSLDDTRLLRVAAVLIDDASLPIAIRAAAISLLAQSSQPTALTVIERACYDPDASVRQAALESLVDRDAQRAQTALSRAATDHDAPSDTRIGAIERLSRLFADESQPLLARCARDTSLPLYARMLCVAALGADALAALGAIVGDDQSHLDIRALAATRLSALGDSAFVPTLRNLLHDPATPPDVLIGLCGGLHTLGEVVVGPLLSLLHRADADSALTSAVIAALARLGADDAVPTLGELVGAGARDRLLRAAPAHLHDEASANALANYQLPPPLALRLASALESAASDAERPTTLREFLNDQADMLRRAAAAALAAIGSNAAQAALMAALLDDAAGSASEAVVQALAQTGGTSSAEALSHLLASAEASPMIRWLAVQALGTHADGQAMLQRGLENNAIDSFIRGAIAEALGQRGAITALPLLRHLAEDTAGDRHLRAQAIIGLGLLDEPATEVVLIRLLSDTNEDQALRSLAAIHLPTQLSTEGRRLLRELLRNERQTEPITIGVVRILGHMRDHEALPLLLRFAQDERGEVARAGLVALGALGDSSIAPVLVRVAQNPAAERATRLQAIGTLLTIGGDSYRPLLRAYLEGGPLPTRLQALDHLLTSSTDPDDLTALLANGDLPLPMRLRVLEACAAQPATSAHLLALAAANHEQLELRVRAMRALRGHCNAADAPTMIELATTAPAALRIGCIEALGTLGGTTACTALSHLAEGSSQPIVVREAARHALRVAVADATAHMHDGAHTSVMI